MTSSRATSELLPWPAEWAARAPGKHVLAFVIGLLFVALSVVDGIAGFITGDIRGFIMLAGGPFSRLCR